MYKKFAFVEIVEILLPHYPPVFDLEVKNTTNQKIPYRLYSGQSFDDLLVAAIKYRIDTGKIHEIKIMNCLESKVIVSYTNSPVENRG